MSLVGKEMVEFSADAYHNGKFVTVSNEDLKEMVNLLFLSS